MRLPRLELFYSPMCSICPQAKAVARGVVEKTNAEYEEINIHSKEGEVRARKYGVDEVPCLIINGQQRISGLPSEEALLKLLEEVRDGT
ncbi:thioredoxin family protein [bacterium]|nr:thioredoxin family protein [bacterium]MBU1599428.1 thioredoxin family protein [bacterium]